MNAIELALLNAISEHPNMPLVIAYSGGVDSQVLLHALALLKQTGALSQAVTICHVNHGLSANAHAWQAFAQQSCLQLKLTLQVRQVNIQVQAQQSLEALARDARYQALHSIYEQASLIITGHHSDDQAETFLLALKRGSGLKGLSAMAAHTKQNKDILVRPLLNISRADIVTYAKAHDLSWIEDESNADTRFDRNFIRNDIMPLLKKRWPSISATINRSSEHCQEGQLLLDELGSDDLNHCQSTATSLNISPLVNLSKARFNNLIRYFLAQHHCLMPSAAQLTQLHQQLQAHTDKNPTVKVGEHYLRRYQNTLYLTPNLNDVSGWQHLVNLSTAVVKITLPDNIGQLTFSSAPSKGQGQALKLPEKGQVVSVRFCHNNPKCLPDYRQHSRSVKKVLQELAIAPWQRKRIPFLYYDDVLVAAIGYFVCQPFIANAFSVKEKKLFCEMISV